MASLSASSLRHLLGDWHDDGPALRALADRIRLLLLDGRIPSGTRLPAERELAAALSVSRTTVAAAYARLRDQEHLHSVRGSGSVLRLPAGEQPAEAPHRSPATVDLTRAALPAAPEVQAAVEAAVADLRAHLPGDGYELLGVADLRRAVADRYTARGLPTTAEEVLVTLGAQHAVGLVCRAVLTPGDRVLVESPGYPHALDAARAAGGRPVAVPVTAAAGPGSGGWDEEALQEAFSRTRPALAYLMPGFHNPTGSVMPADQRRRVVDLARRHGTRLVVDETTNDLAFDGEVPAPFPADVVHVGSAAKSLWGGLRIGWVRADAATVRHLAAHRAPWELGTPVFEQLVVARCLPRLDEILVGRRRELRSRRDALVTGLAAQLPEWEVPHVDGGLALWVRLPTPASSALAVAARRHGVLLTAGPRFGLDGAFERHLRLPFNADAATVRDTVPLLARAWREVGTSVPAPRPFEVVV
ncbi:PLP-dependent aminotransferase family protein [Kineococcus rhizosphaerae]|uniref:GntR family transcriptional regulator n=1 Tax=Kineococcus rhizosphaerae TaxID=559628 RepID=A0A2T0R6L4_9ACTN|nr:PLP-dependent aminotransferase family protein [Kineococcus rhizosphaerae]PRY16760.1 GntR family transcriptional regulator [Kineococcus rhizosphaerae]